MQHNTTQPNPTQHNTTQYMQYDAYIHASMHQYIKETDSQAYIHTSMHASDNDMVHEDVNIGA